MDDLALAKKKKKKPKPEGIPNNKKNKKVHLLETVAALQQNVSALWARLDELSKSSAGAGGVNIYSGAHRVDRLHQGPGDTGAQHLHMYMHINSDCEDRSRDMSAEFVEAHCEVHPNQNLPEDTGSMVTGHIHLTQRHDGGPLNVSVNLRGFDVSGDHASHVHEHGLHIHEFGDVSNGCNSLGSHFDVTGSHHGGPDAGARHSGDWGNIVCDDQGVAIMNFTDESVSLIGDDSIFGRSIVIHQHADDMGVMDTDASRSSGDAGPRIACCVIGRARPHVQAPVVHEGTDMEEPDDEMHEHNH